MRIVIVTGGTGGHIYPALALADYMSKNKKVDILFIGNDDRMEAKIIPERGYAFSSLHTAGLAGNVLQKAKALSLTALAYTKAIKILKEYKPDVVVGFGGYVSVPVIKAAQQMKIKTIIHEQNSVVGKSNLVLAKKATAIVVCYEKCLSELPRNKTYVYGNPRATMAIDYPQDETYMKNLGFDETKPKALVVMGSLGSRSVNDKMKDILPHISNVQFLYVSGKEDFDEMKKAFHNSNVKVVEYIDQLAIAKQFDFVICRAGATTAAEITASGLCSILIPSPYVAHNHQYFNALSLCEQQAAKMIEEKDLSLESLQTTIEGLMKHPGEVESIKKQAQALGFPNACEDITKLIERI